MARTNPFPKDIDQFDNDDRVSFDKQENKYLLVDENAEEWEFNAATGKWFQPATDEQFAQFQQAYGGAYENDENATAPTAADKKRKKAPTSDDSNKKPRVQENRAVFVSNLPLDATSAEIETEFSKWGMIDQSVDGSKRIKMYADDNGEFKGEALVIYFKKESVSMAIRMMDDSWFRPGIEDKIRVQAADLSYKKHQDAQEVKQGMVRRDRKANELNRARMNQRLADWSDEDEASKETFTAPRNKWAKLVIIKHAFTLDELEEDAGAYSDIKEDFREEAEVFGTITNVVIYDREPEGIITVKFRDADSATAFVDKCNGRSFAGRELDVSIAQDRPRFRKSGRGTASDEEEEAERLEKLVE